MRKVNTLTIAPISFMRITIRLQSISVITLTSDLKVRIKDVDKEDGKPVLVVIPNNRAQ